MFRVTNFREIMRLINSHPIIKSNYIQCQIFINHGITFFERYLLKEATRQIATKYSILCRYIISSHLSNIQEVTPRSIPPWSRRAAANRDHTTRMSTLRSDLCCSLRIRPHSANFVGLHQTHGPTCTEECFRGKSLCISYIKTTEECSIYFTFRSPQHSICTTLYYWSHVYRFQSWTLTTWQKVWKVTTRLCLLTKAASSPTSLSWTSGASLEPPRSEWWT